MLHRPLRYLVMCEIPHQSAVDVGVVGDATQDFGTLEGSVWIGAAVAQIPAGGQTKIRQVFQNLSCVHEAVQGKKRTAGLKTNRQKKKSAIL